MELKELINGQTLRFDSHKRGDGSEIKWDDAVHLHKQMNKPYKNQMAQILIYLNKEHAPVFTPENLPEEVKEHLQSEIKGALKKKRLRNKLVKCIIDFWKKCRDIEPPYDSNDLVSLESAIIKIAKNFGCERITDKFLQSKDAWFVAEDKGRKSYFVVNEVSDLYVGANKRKLTQRITSDKSKNNEQNPNNSVGSNDDFASNDELLVK